MRFKTAREGKAKTVICQDFSIHNSHTLLAQPSVMCVLRYKQIRVPNAISPEHQPLLPPPPCLCSGCAWRWPKQRSAPDGSAQNDLRERRAQKREPKLWVIYSLTTIFKYVILECSSNCNTNFNCSENTDKSLPPVTSPSPCNKPLPSAVSNGLS